ncbi:MAG: anthranilate synthase component I [Deltaproteobacteria bacterium]|nr:anthranilate synthase component I [Deltaproteobacteria bacterium]
MKSHVYHPSPDAFKSKAEAGSVVPVYREILADLDTPVSAFMKIDDGGDAFLLESVEGGEKWGRYSFLGVKPRMVVRGKGTSVEIIEEGRVKKAEGPGLELLKGLMSGYKAIHVEGAPRFGGGAIGYLGYDIIRQIERLPSTKPKELDLYDLYFIFTDTFMVFDNVEHKIQVVANAYMDEGADAGTRYKDAVSRIDAMVERLRAGNIPGRKPVAVEPGKITSNFKRADFCKAVEAVKGYISDGDVIQTVISQRFSAPLAAEPIDIYRALRVVNPSPYMFFLRLGDTTLAGSSPEILVRVDDGKVTVKPIAGTRRRGRDDAEDAELAAELLADPKERAEHIMLVDLGRNDIGRVAEAGTVAVDELMTVEKYSHVMHIVSDVRGQLRNGLDAFDAFAACFPAGTLCGAPKVRAMEIIEELEPCRREIYGGAVGYAGYSGNMDLCIAIRTIVIKDGRLHIQAGAGIVADSIPDKEYEETENKARGMWKAVEMAAEGLF